MNKIKELIRTTELFKGLQEEIIEEVSKYSNQVELSQGQTLVRNNTIETHAFILISGSLRLLGKEAFNEELFTVGKASEGSIVGLINVIRQGSCEAAIARQPCQLISIPQAILVELYDKNTTLRNRIDELRSPCEEAKVLREYLNKIEKPPENSKLWIKERIGKSVEDIDLKYRLKLLSTEVPGYENLVGCQITEEQEKLIEEQSRFKPRYIIVDWLNEGENINNTPEERVKIENNVWVPSEVFDMSALGIREATQESDLQGFKIIRGRGALNANLATLRMTARAFNIPCPVDVLENVLEGAIARTGSVHVQGIGQLAESMGLQTQVGEITFENLSKVELPILMKKGFYYVLLTNVDKDGYLFADPEEGWSKSSIEETKSQFGEKIEVVLLKKLSDTPNKEFGWNWFTPVIKRFKWPLVQVLLASLFIQLFQLANPLLLQQIIDKVINQSNLSALQVLGSTLVLAALFQGLLTAVRTWLLIDTTDRMDLLLGSQVIDRLLRLPLRFFEKRPVGELSQRLGELASLRGFLTGTAITSTLDLLFAVIYIFIMLLYSPLMTAVALGTIPIYAGMILLIAPTYRRLIRKQAQYSAKTQSHLIETLSGIQTVKAQHFELNSRWRWQERYSGQIAEAFKSVVLGSSASEIGNFLNQLSSLLIIWVGVYQVVNGELSLGQLIAFRIIAGYVTGPILRLSGLWQGFQQVEISMERLADIIDQTPEAGNNDAEQISLPPIDGNIRFENLKFRFGKSGDYQVNNVNLTIESGSFVGIVGQSGSGKSTLMKLLPRLYSPNNGRILIDGYDISKVSLSSVRQQIGIVPQDCLLFEGTIRENISMNNPEASTEQIIDAAKAAEAHDFIMELPDGYNTRLGERGAGLSGGQKQRIAIARTLLQNPNLLVLDEATSALDYDTEATVCNNLQNQLNGKTVFFITHRLSTVRRADQIIMMHKGEVAEKGTHTELIAKGGRYATLYSHQGDS